MRSHRRIKVFLSTIVAAFALTALVAASASATIVPAKFSSEWAKVSTTGLTLKKNGLEAKTCTFRNPTSVYLTGSLMSIFSEGEQAKLNCPTSISTLSMVLLGEASYDTVTGKYSIHFKDYGAMQLSSPWGYYDQVSNSGGFNAGWENGSGATASTFTLANQTFGWISKQKLTLEGTVKVTTTTGGLLTLSH